MTKCSARSPAGRLLLDRWRDLELGEPFGMNFALLDLGRTQPVAFARSSGVSCWHGVPVLRRVPLRPPLSACASFGLARCSVRAFVGRNFFELKILGWTRSGAARRRARSSA